MKHAFRVALAAPLFALTGLLGCADATNARLDTYPAISLDNAERVQGALGYSPQNVGQFVSAALSLSAMTAQACPQVVTNGTTTTITGGCTAANGTAYEGTATIVADGPTTRITFNQFRSTQQEQCGTTRVAVPTLLDGTLSETRTGANSAYSLNLRVDSSNVTESTCSVAPVQSAVAYEISVVRSGADANTDGVLDHQVWQGHGRAGSSAEGMATIEAVDVVTDPALCANEPVSGVFRLRAGGATAEVTYNGGVDCNMPATAPWTFNGQARGEIRTGCSVAGPLGAGRGAVPLAGTLGALAALAVWRRRARALRHARG